MVPPRAIFGIALQLDSNSFDRQLITWRVFPICQGWYGRVKVNRSGFLSFQFDLTVEIFNRILVFPYEGRLSFWPCYSLIKYPPELVDVPICMKFSADAVLTRPFISPGRKISVTTNFTLKHESMALKADDLDLIYYQASHVCG